MNETPIAQIDLGALKRNAVRIIERVEPRGLLAVVKWDGYGHGLTPCAEILAKAGATGFGVSSLSEGIELRRMGFSGLILVMTDWVGKPLGKFVEWDLHVAATSCFKVEYVASGARNLGKRIGVHIKFDTGLGRLGMNWKKADALLSEIARMKHLDVQGIYSHLGFNGPQDLEIGEKQIERFKHVLKLVHKCGLNPPWTHLANSAAAMVFKDIPGNLVRTGIVLYGQPPSRETVELLPLEPVMTLKAVVLEVQRAHRGRGVPHPLIARAPTDGWAIRIGLGNRHGYPSSLVRRGKFLFRGHSRPLYGAVLKDFSWLFVTGSRPQIGEEVALWGRQGGQNLWLFELAEKIDALPYELPTWLSKKIPRVFVEKSIDS